MNKFLIIIEKTETGFSSYSPDLDGCVATGRTKEEVEKNMYEAIQFHLEGLKEEGIAIPLREQRFSIIRLFSKYRLSQGKLYKIQNQ